MSSKARGLADLGNAFDDGALSNRNLIINGGMVIDQRNGGASVTGSASAAKFAADRFSFLQILLEQLPFNRCQMRQTDLQIPIR